MKAKSKPSSNPSVYLAIAAASVGLFVLTVLPVLNQNFSNTEQQVFTFLYDIPETLLLPMYWITQFGSVSAVVGAAGALWFVGRRRLSLELAINSILAFYLSWGLKSLIARPRPPAYITDLVQREWGIAGNGFPSGHAAIVTVLALTLWPYVEPRYRPLLVILIILVAISRVSLGVHAPLDVVAGICVGVFVVSITKLTAFYLPRLKTIAKLKA